MRHCIVVDGMGGDRAPLSLISGATAAACYLDVDVVLVGDRQVLEDTFEEAELKRPDNLEIVHASEIIGNDESPVEAFRHKPDSSIAVGLRLVKEGRGDAFVSAGNTGALLVGGSLVLGRLPGISRPALCTILPTVTGRGVAVLDVGASTDMRPGQMIQLAVMGSAYASGALECENPSVGLLNIGGEANKGTEFTKKSYQLLSEAETIRFVGNIEPRDVYQGDVEVVVTDGFAGNLLLKSTEGVAQAVFTMFGSALNSSTRARMGGWLAQGALRELKSRLDYTEYGGAPLLGLAQPCIKCHGASNGKAIANGILYAMKYLDSGALEEMASVLENMAKKE